MNIRFFFKRYFNIFTAFLEEWKTISKEKGYAGVIFFDLYLTFLGAVAFFLGALIYSGTTLGVHFILFHSFLVLGINLIFLFIYAFILGKILKYFSKKPEEKIYHLLTGYAYAAYFTGNIIGYLTTPENFFFILFVASFFSAYFFFQGLLTLSKQFNELIAFGIATLFFVLLLVSYFLINNILVLL